VSDFPSTVPLSGRCAMPVRFALVRKSELPLEELPLEGLRL
jgi:hypothetical protein